VYPDFWIWFAGIIEEAAQKAKEGMEEWNGTDRPERKVFFYFIYITVYYRDSSLLYRDLLISSSLLPC
jgi:hypothetical protein